MNSIPHISITDLRALACEPGTLQIEVAEIRSRFVPFAFHAKPGEARVARGVIVESGRLLSSDDLRSLISALHEIVGDFTSIKAPELTQLESFRETAH